MGENIFFNLFSGILCFLFQIEIDPRVLPFKITAVAPAGGAVAVAVPPETPWAWDVTSSGTLKLIHTPLTAAADADLAVARAAGAPSEEQKASLRTAVEVDAINTNPQRNPPNTINVHKFKGGCIFSSDKF